MSTAEQRDFIPVEDYLSAEEVSSTRHEYIDGWVRAMTGATNRHNRVKGNCFANLHHSLRGKPCQPYDSDTKVRIQRQGHSRFYYPDLQVVCESNPATDVYQDRPMVIVEVLSPSTRIYDLDEKLNAYLTIPSLECYVILEQHTPSAIVMRRTSNGFLRETYNGIETTISLPSIGCTLPLGEIYEGVEFTPTCVQEPVTVYEVG